jgi:hypothetical protein
MNKLEFVIEKTTEYGVDKLIFRPTGTSSNYEILYYTEDDGTVSTFYTNAYELKKLCLWFEEIEDSRKAKDELEALKEEFKDFSKEKYERFQYLSKIVK